MALNPTPKVSESSLPTQSLDATTTTPSSKRKQQQDQDTAATTTADDNPEANPALSQKALKKAKRKDHGTKTPGTLHTSTFRKPRFTYLRIRLVTPELISLASTTSKISSISTTTLPAAITTSLPQFLPPQTSDPSISPLTTLTLLTPALTKFLGRTGAAIPIDILHCIARDAYIRVAREDARAVRAALSGWMGWCDGGSIPGLGDEAGKVRVAWRVVGEGGWLGSLSGDGGELFEG